MSLSSDSTCVTFTEFQSLTESEVRKLVFVSKYFTYDLDVIPTMKLNEFFTQFAPVVTEIVNQTLQSGAFQLEWKMTVIKPLLKKKGLPLELKNYRPVSNLAFLSIFLEKAALNQIKSHVETSSLLPDYQSAFRKYHGVETAMVKMYNDLLDNIDNNTVTLVVMVDLSAAFDTIDIPIL